MARSNKLNSFSYLALVVLLFGCIQSSSQQFWKNDKILKQWQPLNFGNGGNYNQPSPPQPPLPPPSYGQPSSHELLPPPPKDNYPPSPPRELYPIIGTGYAIPAQSPPKDLPPLGPPRDLPPLQPLPSPHPIPATGFSELPPSYAPPAPPAPPSPYPGPAPPAPPAPYPAPAPPAPYPAPAPPAPINYQPVAPAPLPVPGPYPPAPGPYPQGPHHHHGPQPLSLPAVAVPNPSIGVVGAFSIQQPVLSNTGETIIENLIGGIPFDCRGRPTGHWRDTRYCDIFHACVYGVQRKTYACPIVGERSYFDEVTRRCEFVYKNPTACGSNAYYK